MRNLMRAALGPLAVTAAVATFLLGPVPTAGADTAIDIGDTATLVSKGAGVLVPIEVTCDPTSFPVFPGGNVSVSLSERSGNRIADGSALASVPCDGTPHAVDVLVRAYDTPFKPGTALATASMFTCDLTGCHSYSTTEEIRIRNN